MNFETDVADALYVNWAVAVDRLPAPPAPLELERVLCEGVTYGFVTLVLFRQSGLRASSVGWPRLSFPQCNLRLPVCDPERVASVWILRELVPAWVVPLARGLAGQPAAAAMFRAAGEHRGGRVCWTVQAGAPLALAARGGAPAVGEPRLGEWRETAAFFRDRPRAYVGGPRLRRIETRHPRVEVLPMLAEPTATGWLESLLPGVDAATWSRPHSAFLVPSARLALEVEPRRAVAVTVEAPAPG